MSSKENLNHLVKTSSDEALIDVINHPENYRNDYVALADVELRKRGFKLDQPGGNYEIAPGPTDDAVPKSVYVQAVVLGTLAPFAFFLPFFLLFEFVLHVQVQAPRGFIPALSMILGSTLVGFRFGYRWPTVGWKWGLWMLPGVAVFTLCAGGLVQTLVFALAGCLGAYMGKHLKLSSLIE